jgi:hypothetical protein
MVQTVRFAHRDGLSKVRPLTKRYVGILVKTYTEKISDVFFIVTVAAFAIYLAADLFGILRLSRELEGFILVALVSLLPMSLILFGTVSWFGGAKRHFHYLQVSAILNLAMAVIIYVVMNSGI